MASNDNTEPTYQNDIISFWYAQCVKKRRCPRCPRHFGNVGSCEVPTESHYTSGCAQMADSRNSFDPAACSRGHARAFETARAARHHCYKLTILRSLPDMPTAPTYLGTLISSLIKLILQFKVFSLSLSPVVSSFLDRGGNLVRIKFIRRVCSCVKFALAVPQLD